MKKTFKVTSEIISKATRENKGNCVGALAIRAEGGWSLSVQLNELRFNYKGRRWYSPTPKNLAKALLAFDQGDDINPFEFTINTSHSHPVEKRPHIRGRGPTINRTPKGKIPVCQRRYHGMTGKAA